jgi:hypothetical protein
MNSTTAGLSFVMLTLCATAAIGEPMKFELKGTGGNCNGCEWVAAEGEITTDTPDVFEKFVKSEDRVNGRHISFHLYFNSPGGTLAAGVKLGELIRKYEYSTGVASTVPDGVGASKTERGRCASACAFAFLGGIVRTADDAEVGFINSIMK